MRSKRTAQHQALSEVKLKLRQNNQANLNELEQKELFERVAQDLLSEKLISKLTKKMANASKEFLNSIIYRYLEV